MWKSGNQGKTADFESGFPDFHIFTYATVFPVTFYASLRIQAVENGLELAPIYALQTVSYYQHQPC
jgi:hypothetical protein